MKNHVKNRAFARQLSVMLFFISSFSPFVSSVYAQDTKISLRLENQSIQYGLESIEKQSEYIFFYDDGIKPLLTKRISLTVNSVPIGTALTKLLESTDLSFKITGKQVLIAPKPTSRSQRQGQLETEADSLVTTDKVIVSGVVTDETGQPLPGVNVVVMSLKLITATDVNGRYTITIPSPDGAVPLRFSFVGMRTVEIIIEEREGMVSRDVRLVPDAQLDELVVTGIFTRTAESFTGAATTLSDDDLVRVGNRNVIESLKNLDPSVYIPVNLTMGSDPNTIPTMSIRGTSSFPLTETSTLKSNYHNQPNQPLIILDGFQTSIEYLVDMDMNRVESVTILKDASAKALYGSKAANGVIVIETKRIGGSEQRITYNGNISLEMPDLTSYDLTNALEKLQVEMAEGVYQSNYHSQQEQNTRLYNDRKKLALEGLSTHWLSKPLRTGVGHKHNLSLELGDSHSLRAILDLTYNQVSGVMKESERQNISGTSHISYRRKNLLFRNVTTFLSNSSTDSPYGSFNSYAKMNPYWQANDADGNVLRWSETNVPNPLYDATIGTSLTSEYTHFTNNFYTEWFISPEWKTTIRFSVSDKKNQADSFYPTNHSNFSNYRSSDLLVRRGRYILENGESRSISGDANVNYMKSVGRHTFFSNLGAFVSEDTYSAYQHFAEGFMNNQMADITFARQYAEGVPPMGYASINRQADFLLAASYDYDNRYLTDLTVRESASSLYGANNRWANSWSLGVGWNIHNEAIFKDIKDVIKMLKLRASVGITGNQNFSTNAAIGTYRYYTGVVYGGFPGAYLHNLPNPNLKWEQKKDNNFGLDARIWGLNLSFDYYFADTKNMLTRVTIPTSTGFASVMDNLGLVRNYGYEVKANYTLWQGRRGFLNIYGTVVNNKNEIISLSESMREYNERMKSLAEDAGTATPVLIYEDGLSMNTIWAVPSAGIDPGTGHEVYLKKDGSKTYRYSAADLVAAGDSDPRYRGIVGFSGEYKGFGLSTTLSFLAGSQMYNYTLVSRVEDADIAWNVDRRVLLGRWQKPGQVTQFKKFQSDEVTRATTRFVQDRNELTISSISAYYEFPESIYKDLGMRRLRLSFYINDVATFSSIKVERGLTYPFARNMSLSLTGTF
ncbi:MAG: SusC/RagA family TonB-linked outer membrane protein [Bacteroidota bacterium]|nr:SusC/RagA family TonB-linked outer membrane protein [Bacteroidota bacterium]